MEQRNLVPCGTPLSDFPLWDELKLYKLNGFKPKTLARQVIKAAEAWLPAGYRFYWSCGTCSVVAPYGDYIWHFVVEIEQERRWNFREFQEGRTFSLDPQRPYRDANPYKHEPARASSWDCGYILGLSERKTTGTSV